MNTKLLLMLLLGLVLASCSKPLKVDCVDYPGEKLAKCQGDPKVPMVTLNTEAMIVEPECVRAHPEATIKFRIVSKGGNAAGSVKIFPKQAADKWLNGTNTTDKDVIELKVPKGTKKGERAYGFRTADKCVDPRVAVEEISGGPES